MKICFKKKKKKFVLKLRREGKYHFELIFKTNETIFHDELKAAKLLSQRYYGVPFNISLHKNLKHKKFVRYFFYFVLVWVWSAALKIPSLLDEKLSIILPTIICSKPFSDFAFLISCAFMNIDYMILKKIKQDYIFSWVDYHSDSHLDRNVIISF